MRYREVHTCLAVGCGIECSLHEMLLHRGACIVAIAVEEEHALGQLSVVEALGSEHVGCDSFVVTVGDEFADALSFVASACFVECSVESEALNVCEEDFLEVGGRHVVRRADKSKHVLEHAAGGSTGRHELHDGVSVGLILLP